jgi:DNA-binding GntR family transcriptional regulator
MRGPFKKALARAVHNPRFWNALNVTLFRLTRFLERERYKNENALPPPQIDRAPRGVRGVETGLG